MIYAKPITLYFIVSFPNSDDKYTGMLRIQGNGKNIITPIALKRRWANASEIAASEFNIAAIKAVIVVPKFEPRIKGSTFFTDILPVATKGTVRDVVTELD